MSQQPQPPKTTPSSATFARQLEELDLAWSLKKLVAKAAESGVTEPERAADHVREQVARKRDIAFTDNDNTRGLAWARLVVMIDADREGFDAFVRRRLDWLALSGEEQQRLLDANRKPATPKQLKFLAELGGDASAVMDSWSASRAIDRLLRARGT